MNCTMEQFTCKAGNGECIALNWMCDDNPDCFDGSDEAECNGTCRSDEFTCANKHCIQNRWLCDHDNDCGDNSDEEYCKLPTCRQEKDFACNENYCINLRWRCDGDYDCPNRLDEKDCENLLTIKSLSFCSNLEFDCNDKITCIHNSWLCDGDKDCPDGTDETLDQCKDNICHTEDHHCSNIKCVPDHLLCDGKRDCIDGRDEVNCNNISKTCNLSSEFKCSEDSCISQEEICDNYINCNYLKHINESLCEINECLADNGGCVHKCTDLPIGYKCDCFIGYKLLDNHNCVDVNECHELGSCSQFCINTEGSFQCSCAAGYLIDPRNKTRCKAAEGHASLLFARRYDIRKIALDRKEITSIINDTKMAIALDFVFRTGMIFWSDISDQKIYKAPIDEGYERTSVIDGDLTISDGLAVDWIYNHIYWTDAKKNSIKVATFSGNMRKTLLSDHVQEPRSIALNPIEGWMFWTDWGNKSRIEKAGMDGSHRMIIVQNDIKWPNGITLDLIGRRVYWVDAKLNIIGSCDYNGLNRRTVLHSIDSLKHPFSVTIFEDYVYWTDWNKETIFKANKFDGSYVETIISVKSLQHPMTVHVYHPYKQPDGINQCQYVNGHCSHLCLPSPKINRSSPLISCACPDELILLPDGLMCIEKEQRKHSIRTNESKRLFKTPAVTISFMVFIIFIVISSVSFLYVYFKDKIHNNITSMNFDNPVYKRTAVDYFNKKINKNVFSTNIGEEILICALRSSKERINLQFVGH